MTFTCLKKGIALVACLIVVSFHPLAQTPSDIAVQNILKQPIPDTAKMRQLAGLAWDLQEEMQYGPSLAAMREGLALGEKKENKCCTWPLLQQMGEYHRFYGHIDSALAYYGLAADAAASEGNLKQVIKTQRAIGNTHYDTGHLETAAKAYAKALEAAILDQDTVKQVFYSQEIASALYLSGKKDSAEAIIRETLRNFKGVSASKAGAVYEYFGNYYYYINDYGPMLSNYLTALENYTLSGDSQGCTDVLMSLALFYSDMGNHTVSLDYYRARKKFMSPHRTAETANLYNSIGWAFKSMGENDSALCYFKKSLHLYLEHSPRHLDKAFPIGNIGLMFEIQNMPDSAIAYSMKADSLFRQMQYPSGRAESQNNIGFALLQKGQTAKAREHFMQGLQLASGINDIFELKNSYRGMYTLEKSSGNFKAALGFLENFNTLQDSLLDIHEISRVQRLEAELEQDRSQSRINELERQSLLNTEKIKRQRIMNIAAILLVLLAAATVFLIIYHWRAKNKALKQLKAQNDTLAKMNNTHRKMISIISHDFRGPLNNIHSLIGMLQQKQISPEEFLSFTGLLYSQTGEVTTMIDTFLKWAVAKNGEVGLKMETLDMNRIISDTMELQRPSANQKQIGLITGKVAPVKVTADKMSVVLVLRNLLSNAIKFSHDQSQVQVGCYVENGFLITYVADRGVGMDKEKLSRIFSDHDLSSSGTRNEKGTGFGLIMSREFVEINGGRIWAESEVGNGTTFYFSLPAKH